MRRRGFVLGLGAAGVLPAAAAPLAQRLRDGSHVLLLRHADAPGVSDPPGFRLDDCSTQRNLGPLGREQARRLGQWLRSQGLAQAAVYSSPWCRCLETARGLELGPVTVEPALGSFFEQPELAAARTAELQALLAQQQRAGAGARIFVTHMVNIRAYAGVVVASAEPLLVRVGERGQALGHERIAVPELPQR